MCPCMATVVHPNDQISAEKRDFRHSGTRATCMTLLHGVQRTERRRMVDWKDGSDTKTLAISAAQRLFLSGATG